MSPEKPTHEEQKAIDRMIDTDIDFTIEQEHIHEVVVTEDEVDE